MTRGEEDGSRTPERRRGRRRGSPIGEVWDDPGSHRSLIDEDAFTALLVEQAGTSLRHLLAGPSLTDPHGSHAQVEHALEVETLLDDFEARHNRRFSFFAQLVASMRCLGRAAQCLHHLLVREPQYHLCWNRRRREDFVDRCEDALQFLDESFLKLQRRAGEECLQWGFATGAPAALPPAGTRATELHLPHDLQTGDDPRQKAVARLFGAFKTAHGTLQALSAHAQQAGERDEDSIDLAAFFGRHLDETRARDVESRLHNLQSAYDSFVRSTPLERKVPRLRSWRGHISLAYHLAEMVTELVHFDERHEDAVQSTEHHLQLASLVDRRGVLRTAHFGLICMAEVLDSVAALNDQLREHLVPEVRLDRDIPPGAVLHARPLSIIAQTVTEHGTPVRLEIEGDSAPASSLLAMLLLAGKYPDSRSVSFHGDAEALAALEQRFDEGLWEDDEHDPGGVSPLAD